MAGGFNLGVRQIKYREQPFVSFGTREFLSGISPGGANQGALFYKADGVTPLVEPGTAQSANNGLLMCGASATTVLGTLTGSIIASTPDIGIAYVSGGAFFSTDDNKLWKLQTDNTFATALGSIHTAGSTLTPGLLSFQSSAGTHYLLYRQVNQIGRTSDAVLFTDNWLNSGTSPAIATDYFGAMYQYFDTVLFGNGLGALGKLNADLTAGTGLTLPKDSYVTAIADDGVYAAIAISRNQSGDGNVIADTRILFWDGYASSWLREYPIPDPFIYALKKTPLGLYAFGVTGIWNCSFRGVKKNFSISPGIYTAAGASAIHYGKGSVSYFSDALMWGGTSGSNRALKTLGQLDSDFKGAYYTPVLLTASKNITCVDAQLLKGWVYVGDSTPQLLAYPMSTANALQIGNTAQTTYFSIKERFQVNRVDVIFGVPLASGDSFSLSILQDENTAAVSVGSATFAADGAIRRKSMYSENPIQIDEQFSVKLTFTAGAVKVKRVDVYGHWMNP